MKTLLACSLGLLSLASMFAATEESLNRRFAVTPGGQVTVDVDFGVIVVTTNATSEVAVDVYRKVSLRNKSDETKFLADQPVVFEQKGNSVVIRSRNKAGRQWKDRKKMRLEGKYTVSVPAQFGAQLKTGGGAIQVADLTGEVKANTSGGNLNFNRLNGPLHGDTSGGSVQVDGCHGELKVGTSGGRVAVSDGSGNLQANTSGGDMVVRNFAGPVRVNTSGGDISLENLDGEVHGSTSGGTISARLNSLEGEVKLTTSGGNVLVRVPGNAAYNLDAETSGGNVSSDLPVVSTGKPNRNHLRGPVNGGGRSMVLRSSGGNIQVRKL